MTQALELLRDCNQILIRLYDVNKYQLESMKNGDFNRLDLFADKRQAILEMLDIVEEQLDAKIESIEDTDKARIAKEISLRKEILQTILHQEMDLHKLVEQEKSRTILDMQTNQKNLKVTGAYKSRQSEPKKNLKEV